MAISIRPLPFLRCLLVAGLSFSVALASHTAAGARVEEGEPAPPEPEIAELVQQLGSDLFVERDAAQARLEMLGIQAFDALQEAVKHPDLEVATRARHILERVKVEWVKPTDPPEVRQLMKRFASGSTAKRLALLEKLKDLEEAGGGPALCRIARFETTANAEQAALSGLSLLESAGTDGVAADSWLEELDESQTVAARWVRLGLHSLTEPRAALDEWDAECAAAVDRFRGSGQESDAIDAYRLMRFRLFVSTIIEASDPRMDALAGLAEFLAGLEEEQLPDLPDAIGSWFKSEEEQSAKAVAYQLFWAADRKDWGLWRSLVTEHAAEISQNRFLLYSVALAHAQQGDTQEAAHAVQRALEYEAEDAEHRNRIAASLLEQGRLDLAAGEWRAVIAALPTLHPESLIARQELGNWWLHDREQYQAAVDLLDEFCQAAEASDEAEAAMLADLAESMSNADRADHLWKSFRATREYFEACRQRSLGAHKQEQLSLEKAYRLYPVNPDILIAMYRVKGADPAYRARVRDMIKSLSRRIQHVIDAGLASGQEDAQDYNLWAWLVSNTEGDYQQAVRYSHRSLELDPDNASFLDTLGRCYYAAKDFDSAIKYQKMAVERQPMVQVMQRQLRQFEEEAASSARERESEATDPFGAF